MLSKLSMIGIDGFAWPDVFPFVQQSRVGESKLGQNGNDCRPHGIRYSRIWAEEHRADERCKYVYWYLGTFHVDTFFVLLGASGDVVGQLNLTLALFQ